jgi:glucose/arabinose dehydrogenase
MLAAAASLVAVATATPAQADPGLVEVGQALQPVYVASPPRDASRLFIVEQGGAIRVLENGELLARPFLDLTPRVHFGGLQGLLSMEFAPDYPQSRRFYVFFTDRENRTRVEEYRRSRTDPTVAQRSSSRTILSLPLPLSPEGVLPPHLGGQLEFGPDGLLYITIGDGSQGFRDSRMTKLARDRSSLFGKVLRIDPVAPGGRRYGIPESNPYAGRTPGKGEIYASGLRNPWRLSFDHRTAFIGDDGESSREEVDVLSLRRLRGADLGWPVFEGTLRLRRGASRRSITMPALEYPHHWDDVGMCDGAVIGGYVVRDRSVPSLYGRYVYADYCFRELRSFDPRAPRQTDRLEIDIDRPAITSFGRDSKGHVYVVFETGEISRLVEQ